MWQGLIQGKAGDVPALFGRLCILFWLLLATSSAALAQTRVALVVANGSYAGATLANPQIDLGIVVPPLEAAGFEVTTVSDAGLAEFDAALNGFAAKAEGADIALFYFAGHGFALNDGIHVSSYLMSTDADVTSSSDRLLMAAGIELDAIVRQLTERAKVTLIFVDACRNDPRVRAVGSAGRGLAPVADVSIGDVFVGLSTRIGDTATDGAPGQGSPFARAFASHMAEPGLSVDRAFNKVRLTVQAETRTQRPEAGRNDLTNPDAVVLVPGDGTIGPDPAAAAWALIEDSDSPAVLSGFAEAFPDTIFARLALARAEELLAAAPPESDGTPAPADGKQKVTGQVASLPGTQQGAALLDFPVIEEARGPFSDQCVDPATPGTGNTIPACQRALLANPGNAQLQFLMGRSYGVEGDYARALAWYNASAENGNAAAMLHAGIFHHDGIGVPVDPARAAEWYRRSAENGNAAAMLRLGRLHLEGSGVSQDYAEALRWLESAVSNGSRDAYASLAAALSNAPPALRDHDRAAALILASLSFKAEGSEANLAAKFSRYDAETRKAMQRLLKARGAYAGSIDGVFGPTTMAALQAIFAGPAGSWTL